MNRHCVGKTIDWLVGSLFWFNGSLKQYFSLYRAVFQREGEREKMTGERKIIMVHVDKTVKGLDFVLYS